MAPEVDDRHHANHQTIDVVLLSGTLPAVVRAFPRTLAAHKDEDGSEVSMHIRRATTTLVLAASMLSTPALPAGSTESAVIETAQPDVVESEPHGIADARSTVAELLGNHGLSDAQIDERLGQLSDEDLLYLADHADQVQEGGSSPPEYIWILLGVFLVVAIVAAVL